MRLLIEHDGSGDVISVAFLAAAPDLERAPTPGTQVLYVSPEAVDLPADVSRLPRESLAAHCAEIQKSFRVEGDRVFRKPKSLV